MPDPAQDVSAAAEVASDAEGEPETPLPAPIPNEILLIIAEYMDPTLSQAVALTAVCTRWRRLFLALTSLWRRVTGVQAAGMKVLDIVLSRSATGDNPLVIDCILAGGCYRGIKHLRSSMSRVEELSFTYNGRGEMVELYMLFGQQLGRLRELHHFGRFPRRFPLNVALAPNLQSLSMRISLLRHLPADALAQIRDFRAVAPTAADHDDTRSHSLMELLRIAPNIMVLTLDAVPWDAGRSVQFPALVSFTVTLCEEDRYEAAVRPMLLGLNVPGLAFTQFNGFPSVAVKELKDYLPPAIKLVLTRDHHTRELDVCLESENPNRVRRLSGCRFEQIKVFFSTQNILDRLNGVTSLTISLCFDAQDSKFLPRLTFPVLKEFTVVVPPDDPHAHVVATGRVHILRDSGVLLCFSAPTLSLLRFVVSTSEPAPQTFGLTFTVTAKDLLAFLRRTRHSLVRPKLDVDLNWRVQLEGSDADMNLLRQRIQPAGNILFQWPASLGPES